MKNYRYLLVLGLLLQVGCSNMQQSRPHTQNYPSYPNTPSKPQPSTAEVNVYQLPDADLVKPIEQSQIKVEAPVQNQPQAAPLSAAQLALLEEADRNHQAGNLEAAIVSVERALRIDSRNAQLTYKLAELRLQDSKPRLAEDLAKKAELLAGGDTGLKKQCWLLIAQARLLQQDYLGAEEAQLKAESF